MTLRQKRSFWFFVWILIILSGPVTVLRNTVFPSEYLTVINIFQRITGLLAFSLLFIQIMLGSFMGRWVQILGARAFKLHITEGLVTYGFILIHPLMQVLIDFELRGVLGAFMTLLPGRDIFLNLGKISLLLLTIGVSAAYFRTKPFFRRNWRAFHILNYLAFFLIVVHSRGVGTDIRTPPFVWFYWVAVFSVSFSIIYRLALPFVKKYFFKGTSYERAKNS